MVSQHTSKDSNLRVDDNVGGDYGSIAEGQAVGLVLLNFDTMLNLDLSRDDEFCASSVHPYRTSVKVHFATQRLTIA